MSESYDIIVDRCMVRMSERTLVSVRLWIENETAILFQSTSHCSTVKTSSALNLTASSSSHVRIVVHPAAFVKKNISPRPPLPSLRRANAARSAASLGMAWSTEAARSAAKRAQASAAVRPARKASLMSVGAQSESCGGRDMGGRVCEGGCRGREGVKEGVKVSVFSVKGSVFSVMVPGFSVNVSVWCSV